MCSSLCLGASSTGDLSAVLPTNPTPTPRWETPAMTRIEAAARIDAHSAFTPSAHEFTLRSSPTSRPPYSSKAASFPPLHNAKSRTKLFSINVTLGGGGWVDPLRKWPFSVGSVLSSLRFLACVSWPFRNNRGFGACGANQRYLAVEARACSRTAVLQVISTLTLSCCI